MDFFWQNIGMLAVSFREKSEKGILWTFMDIWEPSVNIPWTIYEHCQDILWTTDRWVASRTRVGHLRDTSGATFEVASGARLSLLGHVRHMWGTCRITLGHFWDTFGSPLGCFLDHAWITSGQCLKHFWDTLDNFWITLGTSTVHRLSTSWF